jgi:methionyl-tRNA formyltransferase
VVAYGRILDPPVLALPAAGFVNLHFSLLPRWRGAAPVERALIAGDTMTGVTVIKIDEGLDTGPVLTAQAVDINPDENGGELTGRLANLGGRLIVTVLAAYMSGSVAPVAQSDEGATYATKISADDRVLANSSSATEFVNRVRALAPSPAATIEIDGQAHKIFKARPHHHAPDDGTWVVVDSVPVLGVGAAGVELVSLQPSGKTPRSGEDWVRGRRTEAGVFS